MKFILADAGYDVWLGNNRGNTYSDTNEFYGNDEDEFWDFSWDEMASIDMPTQINVGSIVYIIQVLKLCSMHYNTQGKRNYTILDIQKELRKLLLVLRTLMLLRR